MYSSDNSGLTRVSCTRGADRYGCGSLAPSVVDVARDGAVVPVIRGFDTSEAGAIAYFVVSRSFGPQCVKIQGIGDMTRATNPSRVHAQPIPRPENTRNMSTG